VEELLLAALASLLLGGFCYKQGTKILRPIVYPANKGQISKNSWASIGFVLGWLVLFLFFTGMTWRVIYLLLTNSS